MLLQTLIFAEIDIGRKRFTTQLTRSHKARLSSHSEVEHLHLLPEPLPPPPPPLHLRRASEKSAVRLTKYQESTRNHKFKVLLQREVTVENPTGISHEFPEIAFRRKCSECWFLPMMLSSINA